MTNDELYQALQDFKQFIQANFPFKQTTFSGTEDPSDAGLALPERTFFIQVDGSGAVTQIYYKQGPGDYDWHRFGDVLSGDLSSSTGAEMVGYGTETVASKLLELANSVASGLTGGAPMWGSIGEGLDNTVVDQFFTVPGTGDDYSILYRHDPGDVATEIGSSPSTALVNRVARFEDDSSFLPYALVEYDDNSGRVFRTIRHGDAEHKMWAPLTYDSVTGFSMGAVEGVSKVLRNAGGQVVSYVLADGTVVSIRGLFAQGGGLPPITETVLPALSYDADRVPELAHTWWIAPIAVRFQNHLFFGGVGNGDEYTGALGEITICQRYKQRPIQAVNIGTQTDVASPNLTDEHNAPAIIIDPRPSAVSPVMAFQTDHVRPASSARVWRSDRMDVRYLTDSSTIPNTASSTYSMPYRNPDNLDEIWLFQRSGGGGGGLWQIIRSLDNGQTWTSHDFISDNNMYIGTCRSANGVLIGFQTHPSAAPDRSLFLTELRWDGQLVNPDGAVWEADIWSAPILHPLSDPNAFLVHQSPEGIRRRLFSMTEDAGQALMLFAEYDNANVRATSVYKLAAVSMGSGDVTVTDHGSPGSYIGDQYLSGGCVRSADDMILTRWHGSSDPDEGVMEHWRQEGGAWSSTEILRRPHKIIRPSAIRRVAYGGSYSEILTPEIMFLEGDYTGFYDMDLASVIATVEL